MSQSVFGARAGLGQTMIGMIETGARRPSRAAAKALSAATNSELNWVEIFDYDHDREATS